MVEDPILSFLTELKRQKQTAGQKIYLRLCLRDKLLFSVFTQDFDFYFDSLLLNSIVVLSLQEQSADTDAPER